MIGQKVLCIDAGDIHLCINFGMIPLKESEVYTIRGESQGGKGVGYLLEEIQNDFNVYHNGVHLPNVEPSYSKHRFIPISEIDETEIIYSKETIETIV